LVDSPPINDTPQTVVCGCHYLAVLVQRLRLTLT
jgi:hypothetical protein